MEFQYLQALTFFGENGDTDEAFQSANKTWAEAKLACSCGILLHLLGGGLEDKMQVRKGCKAQLEQCDRMKLELPLGLRDRAQKAVRMQL